MEVKETCWHNCSIMQCNRKMAGYQHLPFPMRVEFRIIKNYIDITLTATLYCVLLFNRMRSKVLQRNCDHSSNHQKNTSKKKKKKELKKMMKSFFCRFLESTWFHTRMGQIFLAHKHREESDTAAIHLRSTKTLRKLEWIFLCLISYQLSWVT